MMRRMRGYAIGIGCPEIRTGNSARFPTSFLGVASVIAPRAEHSHIGDLQGELGCLLAWDHVVDACTATLYDMRMAVLAPVACSA